MNKRQVIILWSIALILGIVVAVVKHSQHQANTTTTKRTVGQSLFEAFPGAEATTIELSDGATSTTLIKKDNQWSVNERDGYPANTTNLYDWFRSIHDLKISRTIEAGVSFAPRFGMDEKSKNPDEHGIVATFKDASGKEISKLAFGKTLEAKQDPTAPMGASVARYLRNYQDESGFYASAEMFPALSSNPARWLKDDFFCPEKIKTITASQLGKSDQEWQVAADTEEAEMKLMNPVGDEVLDRGAAVQLKQVFTYARFEDILPKAKASEHIDAAKIRTVTITTFEGFTYTLAISPEKNGETPNLYTLTVKVSADLPKERKKDANEKPEEAKAKDAAFTSRLTTLTDKLAKEKACENTTYLVNASVVNTLLRPKAEIIAKATDAVSQPGTPVQTLPNGFIAPQPPTQDATKKTVEAFTPPISVPPANEDAKPAQQPEPAAPSKK